MKKILQITAGLFVGVTLAAQTVPGKVMTNLGVLKVATVGTSSAILFVDGTFQAKDASAIELDGNMIITGNFVQNAARPAFVSSEYVPDNNKVSTGVFTFRGDFANGTRVHQIKTDNGADVHNRGEQYLAFPNIRFDTNDTIVLTSFMGIDALSIKASSGKSGKLLLASEIAGDGRVYDASLRFPSSNATKDSVPAGTVAIERNVKLYRSNQTDQLSAFASPFHNQRSGYFAGNWVRNPIIDASGYVMYPLADAMDANGYIYPEYYVIDPREQLKVGQPYITRYNNSSYTYDPEHDLLWTGGSTGQNTKDVYLFNGSPYTLGFQAEQIVTDTVLYQHTLPSMSTGSKWIVVGNSYSAPISVEKLVNYLLGLSSGGTIKFYKYLYYFPAGSQGYQTLDMSQNVNAFNLKYIPSQSIFMVRRTGGTGAELKFDKSLTVQAKVSNNLVAENGGAGAVYAPGLHRNVMSNVDDEYFAPNLLRFKVSPADNESVYDLSAIFVRTDALAGNDKYDMPKYFNGDNGSFQLSMCDDANVRQFQMGVPVTTASANMSFRPTVYGGNFILTVSNVESMTTQAVVLEDTKTNIFQDLRENPIYEFETEASDYENRFIVHFLPQNVTANPDLTEGAINAYYNNNNAIVVNKLNEKDINSTVEVIDIQGRIVTKETIKSYPTQNIDAYLADGVYIVRVKGARNYTGKVVVK